MAVAYVGAAILTVATVWFLVGHQPAAIGDRPEGPSAASPGGLLGSPAVRVALDGCTFSGSKPPATAIEAVGNIDLHAAGVRDPAALSYIPGYRALLAVEREGGLPLVTLFGDRAGLLQIADGQVRPARLAYDAPLGAYLAWHPGDPLVALVAAGRDGSPAPKAAGRLDLRAVGIESLEMMAVDAGTGDLYVEEADGRRIVSIPLSPARVKRAASFDLDGACELTLALPDGLRPQAIAVEPGGARVFAVTGGEGGIYEFDRGGRQLALHDVHSLGLAGVSAMAFGPASDPRDAGRASLYVAGAGVGADGAGRLIELATGTAQAKTDDHVDLIAAHRTSEWRPPSADPGGLAYDERRRLLVVTDSEIDELASFEGANVFFVGSSLMPLDHALTAFTTEPSDVAIDPATGDYLFSDDSQGRIYRVRLGADAQLGGDDDLVSSFSTVGFGTQDSDGLSVGQGSIFLTDGAHSLVYRLTPGPDGEFTGVEPGRDDVAVGFNTRALGVKDPEAVAYDPTRGTLYLVTDGRNPNLLEVTTTGVLLRSLDLSFVPLENPAGITLAPSSDDPERQSVYLVDRGIDNSENPDENDGTIFELRIEPGALPNLVRNGGFEVDTNADGLPDGWQLANGTLAGAAEARSGQVVLRLAAEGQPSAARYDAPLSPRLDGAVRFSAWVKTLSNPRGPVTARILWRAANGSTIATDRLATVVPGTDWVEISGTATRAVGAVIARLTIELSSGAGAILVDDVAISPP